MRLLFASIAPTPGVAMRHTESTLFPRDETVFAATQKKEMKGDVGVFFLAQRSLCETRV